MAAFAIEQNPSNQESRQYEKKIYPAPTQPAYREKDFID
jgi:hypothetical protein